MSAPRGDASAKADSTAPSPADEPSTASSTGPLGSGRPRTTTTGQRPRGQTHGGGTQQQAAERPEPPAADHDERGGPRLDLQHHQRLADGETSRVTSTPARLCGIAPQPRSACRPPTPAPPPSTDSTGAAGRQTHRRPPEGVHQPQSHAAPSGLPCRDLHRVEARRRAVHSHDDRVRHGTSMTRRDRAGPPPTAPSSSFQAPPGCAAPHQMAPHRAAANLGRPVWHRKAANRQISPARPCRGGSLRLGSRWKDSERTGGTGICWRCHERCARA